MHWLSQWHCCVPLCTCTVALLGKVIYFVHIWALWIDDQSLFGVTSWHFLSSLWFLGVLSGRCRHLKRDYKWTCVALRWMERHSVYRTFLKSLTPWRRVLDFLKKSWLEQYSLLLCSGRMPGSWCTADRAWPGEGLHIASRLTGCLFGMLPDSVSDNWCILLIEGQLVFFFKLETPNLLTVYVLEMKEYVSPWLETELKYGTFHLPHPLSPVSLMPKLIIMKIPWQSLRYLSLRSQTYSLRKSWILMSERLAKNIVMKHFCGLSIMILSGKRWSLIKSRLSCFLLAC